MKDLQKTLSKSVKINGIGLHTGQVVEINILPAAENHGYKFQRIDIEGKPIINALVDNVVDTSRGTTIEENGARVYTDDGWGLVRASSNTPTLVLRFESKTKDGLEKVINLRETINEGKGRTRKYSIFDYRKSQESSETIRQTPTEMSVKI